MDAFEAIALGYDYPSPDRLAQLETAVESLRGGARRHMDEFIDQLRGLDLGAWEELHTFTLDLSPQFVPYVGHVAWGENYRRGAFMADLNRAMIDAHVDLGGELPDHIAPILRYLAAVDVPLSDLIDELPGAVESMRSTLKSAAPSNPYRHLLAATAVVVGDLAAVTIGGVS
jgi:nitrate reductase delta subunit